MDGEGNDGGGVSSGLGGKIWTEERVEEEGGETQPGGEVMT